MRVQEAARGAPAVRAQHLEEIIVGAEPAGCVQRLCRAGERNTMHVDTAVLPGTGTTRQLAFIDKLAHESDAAQLQEELNVISFIRAKISSCVFGSFLRCSGLICTSSRFSVCVAPISG